MTRVILVVAVLLCLAVSGEGAKGGDLSGLPGGMECADRFNDGSQHCRLVIEAGTISSPLVDGVRTLLAKARGTDPRLERAIMYLDSSGGDVDAAMALGRILRAEKLPVVIRKGAQCLGPCVLVLAAAQDRTVLGLVGVRSPYFPSLAAVPREQILEMRNAVRAYVREMGASEQLALDLLEIEPDRMRYLTAAALAAYGLAARTSLPGEQNDDELETASVRGASAYGIDRDEYRRREALVQRTCRLDLLDSRGQPQDLNAMALTASEIGAAGESPRQRMEETAWSRCYKTIMKFGL
jgi:hypothetical protein